MKLLCIGGPCEGMTRLEKHAELTPEDETEFGKAFFADLDSQKDRLSEAKIYGAACEYYGIPCPHPAVFCRDFPYSSHDPCFECDACGIRVVGPRKGVGYWGPKGCI